MYIIEWNGKDCYKMIKVNRQTFPEPFRPVTAEKEGSHPVMDVLTGYDLNPSRMSSSRYI